MTGLQDQDDDGDAGLSAAASSWLRGEERLYLAALSGTEAYEHSLDLVRRTVEHLRTWGPGPAPLQAAGARGPELVTDAVGQESVGAARVDLALVADAALAVRYREVLSERRASRRLEQLAAAHGCADGWVVLETSGDPDGDPLRPYRRLEADSRTGRAVLVTTAPEEDFTHCLHAVEALRVDLSTGVLAELELADVTATVHPTSVERERRAAALRRQLSGL
ncbi:MAG: hypothetical protein M4D85_07395 [Actinomycetota bacterium]|nr:hypothetical protein [Actinomycetota bacterium]